MALDWNDVGGELRVLIWSPDYRVMPAGSGLLLSIPGGARFEVTKAEVADYRGNMLSLRWAEKEDTGFSLKEAVPNPFKGATEIGFAVASEVVVNLSVYDVSGKLVKKILNEKLLLCEYRVTWDGRDESGRPVRNGVYFVRITAGEFSASRKLLLLR